MYFSANEYKDTRQVYYWKNQLHSSSFSKCVISICRWRWQLLSSFSSSSSSRSFRLLWLDIDGCLDRCTGLHYPTHFEETFQIVYLTDGHYHQYERFEGRPQNDSRVRALVDSTVEFVANTHILLFVLHWCQTTAQFANLECKKISM